MAWYNEQKLKVFDSRHVLEQYCQDDVTVLRQACRVFRREFLEIGNIEVFLEALTIASACNKVLRKKFLKPETIGLIPPGGYSANRRYSKKALKWLLHMERTDGCHIQHGRKRGAIINLQNFHITAWTVTVQRIEPFMNSWDVTITAVSVSRSVT
jgi:hypothetical protein